MKNMPLGKVIRRRRKDLKLTLEQVAADVPGYDASNLSKFERGLQGIDPIKLEALAARLNTSVASLYLELESEHHGSAGPEIVMELPLITWAQAGGPEGTLEIYQSRTYEKLVPVTKRYSKHAFALRLRDDSMQSAEGPSFAKGAIITVEPKREAGHGSFVVARTDDSPEATFKQLVADGGSLYLKPLNQRYPIQPFPKGSKICGVVLQAIQDLEYQ